MVCGAAQILVGQQPKIEIEDVGRLGETDRVMPLWKPILSRQTFAAVRHKRNAEELGHQPMPRTVKIDKLLCQRCGYLLSQRDTIDLWPV